MTDELKAKIIARGNADPAFKKAFLDDPNKAIASIGGDELSLEELDGVAGGYGAIWTDLRPEGASAGEGHGTNHSG